MTFFVDALVVGAHAGDAIAVEKQFRSGKSSEDRDPGLFHLAAQPLHKSVQRNHVVAVVAQKRRRDRQLELALLGEEINRFLRDLGIERRFLLKSRKQFAHRPRIKQRARKTVLPNLARLLQHVNIFFAELRIRMRGVVRVDQLRQPQRAGHARRPAADDDHIGRHLRAFNAFDRFAEDQHKNKSAADLRGSTRIRSSEFDP